MNPIAIAMGWGFAAAMLPGPFQVYLINKALSTGWRQSIALVFVPLMSDLPAIFLAVFVLGQLPAGIIRLIQIVGGLYVAKIAYGSWKRFRQGIHVGTNAGSESQALASGVMMNFLNPNTYIFWGTVSGPLLIQQLHHSVFDGGLFLGGFYGIFVLVDVGLVAVFTILRRLNGRISEVITALTIILLLAFSISLIVQGVSGG